MSDYTCKESTIKDIERLEFLVLSGLDKECEGVMGGYNPSSFLRGLSYGLERANEIISNQPTVDEKEIIRNAAKRIIDRLEYQEKQYESRAESFAEVSSWEESRNRGKAYSYSYAIEIVKEECGISE